jgi:Cdc6-like AAA superfamily ATPase
VYGILRGRFRSKEKAVVKKALESLLATQKMCFIVIEGSPGIGKTELLRYFLDKQLP